jgi:hypothetical protein
MYSQRAFSWNITLICILRNRLDKLAFLYVSKAHINKHIYKRQALFNICENLGFFVSVLCIVCTILSVSLDCAFVIAPSVCFLKWTETCVWRVIFVRGPKQWDASFWSGRNSGKIVVLGLIVFISTSRSNPMNLCTHRKHTKVHKLSVWIVSNNHGLKPNHGNVGQCWILIILKCWINARVNRRGNHKCTIQRH